MAGAKKSIKSYFKSKNSETQNVEDSQNQNKCNSNANEDIPVAKKPRVENRQENSEVNQLLFNVFGIRTIEKGWHSILETEFSKLYFKHLLKFIEKVKHRKFFTS